MSTPATQTPVAVEEKKGLSKYVSRVKSILRRGDSSKRLSTGSMLSPLAASSAAPPTSAPNPTSTTDTVAPASETVVRTTVELERARALAQKYNIDLEPRDWKVIEVAERIEKPIRMRIHRNCHRCGASFGATKICSSCSHRRCDECPRYPKKKPRGDKGKGLTKLDDQRGPSGVPAVRVGGGDDGLKRKHRYVLTLPSRTGGQDLVYKKPVQRVRRNCHRCDAVFMPGNRSCLKCGHTRCVNCPRDPPKPDKYPDGYPGDAPASSDDEAASTGSPARVYTKPRRTTRYSCHECSKIFKAPETKCTKCGHDKCSECPRVPPRKVKPEPDPDIVRRVEERLKALGVRTAGLEPEPLPNETSEEILAVDDLAKT